MLLLPTGSAAVEYEVVFDATWSAVTHPDDFPTGSAHFSPLVGATHDATITLWEAGGLATPGIEAMAELGATGPLIGEIEEPIAVGAAASTVLGGGVGRSPGTASARFEIDFPHPRVTLVTMIAPSPDWFVGVSGLELAQDGTWIDELSVDLHPYDAGTDDGATFLAPNADSDPQRPIQRITGFPFAGAPPLGRFTFRLLPEPRGIVPLLAVLPGLRILRRRLRSSPDRPPR